MSRRFKNAGPYHIGSLHPADPTQSAFWDVPEDRPRTVINDAGDRVEVMVRPSIHFDAKARKEARSLGQHVHFCGGMVLIEVRPGAGRAGAQP